VRRAAAFSSKEELLHALSAHEQAHFETAMADAIRGLSGARRLDRALRFIVEFQRDYPFDQLVLLEPAFMLDQLERSLRTMVSGLVPLFEDVTTPPDAKPADLADLVMRVALSHFLIRGSDAQLLRQLRHVVGIRG